MLHVIIIFNISLLNYHLQPALHMRGLFLWELFFLNRRGPTNFDFQTFYKGQCLDITSRFSDEQNYFQIECYDQACLDDNGLRHYLICILVFTAREG